MRKITDPVETENPCPVCQGQGRVAQMFYSKPDRQGNRRELFEPVDCKECEGTGIDKELRHNRTNAEPGDQNDTHNNDRDNQEQHEVVSQQ